MDELKPCPFCGGTNVYETLNEERAGYKNPMIFCNWCKAIFTIEDDSPYVMIDEDYEYRRKKTIQAWNRRAKE